jgi:hypothetical protein
VRLHLISCEVFYREICHVVARSPHQVTIRFLSKGLHNLAGPAMRQRIQDAIDACDSSGNDAVLMGYGLCGLGLAGIIARSAPVVIPRAHDCITVLLGSRKRYASYALENPGTYFLSSGWIERNGTPESEWQLSPFLSSGPTVVYDDLVAKYGEDNAKFLWMELCGPPKQYSSLAFIPMGVEPTEQFRRKARERAERKGMKYLELKGDMTLLERLVNGPWEKDFVVLQPDESLMPTYDDEIMGAGTADPAPGAEGQAGASGQASTGSSGQAGTTAFGQAGTNVPGRAGTDISGQAGDSLTAEAGAKLIGQAGAEPSGQPGADSDGAAAPAGSSSLPRTPGSKTPGP